MKIIIMVYLKTIKCMPLKVESYRISDYHNTALFIMNITMSLTGWLKPCNKGLSSYKIFLPSCLFNSLL